eukprot:2647342-Pleurochrysis_carterae.AAC.2
MYSKGMSDDASPPSAACPPPPPATRSQMPASSARRPTLPPQAPPARQARAVPSAAPSPATLAACKKMTCRSPPPTQSATAWASGRPRHGEIVAASPCARNVGTAPPRLLS